MDDLAESLYYQIAEHTAGCPEGEIPVGEASCGCERDNIRKIADEIETLKARYRSLLDKHLALFTKRQRAEQRLRDVAEFIGATVVNNWPFLAKALMIVLGYVRCECGGSGWYVGATVADEYHNPMQEQIECPCVANGTTGWREQ